MLKTIWMNIDEREIYTTREEMDAMREQLILIYMKEENVTREEAENAVDCYIEENCVVTDIDLDDGPVFWVDYHEGSIMSDTELEEQATDSMPFLDWLDEEYSPSELYMEMEAYGPYRLEDWYVDEVVTSYIETYNLEKIEIEIEKEEC